MQKTIPQNIDIWQNDGHFMTKTHSWDGMLRISIFNILIGFFYKWLTFHTSQINFHNHVSRNTFLVNSKTSPAP